MAIETKVYNTNDFERGTRGSRDTFHYEQSFLGDVRLYPDGSIGPRPRWKQWAGDHLTPPSLGFSSTATIVPAVQRLSISATVRQGFLVVDSVGTGIHFTYDSGGSTATILSGVLAHAYGPHSWVSRIGSFEWLIDDFFINLNGASITAVDCRAAVTTTFAGARTYNFVGSAIHQGSAFFWGPMINGTAIEDANRIYYSDPYSYGTFASADQFFDVDGPVAGCASIGSSLLIWTEAAEWFILQGRDDPADNTLNSISKGRIPEQGRQPARFDNVLVFRASDRQATVIVGEDGEIDDKSLSYLIYNTNPGTAYYGTDAAPSAVANSVANSVIIPKADGFNGCHHNGNGVWTDEQWGFSSVATVNRMDETQSREVLLRLIGSVWFAYERPVVIHSPEQTDGSHIETPSGRISLPRIQLPSRNLRVRRVVIDGRYWKQDPFFEGPTLEVEVRDGDDDTTGLSSVGTPTDAIDTNFSSGRSFRQIFKPDEILNFTQFAEVKLKNMASVSVQTVTVEYEISDQELL